jgi:hypothetical protein
MTVELEVDLAWEDDRSCPVMTDLEEEQWKLGLNNILELLLASTIK